MPTVWVPFSSVLVNPSPFIHPHWYSYSGTVILWENGDTCLHRHIVMKALNEPSFRAASRANMTYALGNPFNRLRRAARCLYGQSGAVPLAPMQARI